jgi:hypothetical protein
VLEVPDPGLHEALFVLGGVVFRVLSDVAVLAGTKKPLGRGRTTLGLQLLDLFAHSDVCVQRQARRGLLTRLSRRSLRWKESLVFHIRQSTNLPSPSTPDRERWGGPPCENAVGIEHDVEEKRATA